MLDQRQRLRGVTRVRVHLAAAGLPVGEDNFMAKPLEQGDGRLAHFGIQHIAEARDEEPDPHVLLTA